jgi:hypothetical protein
MLKIEALNAPAPRPATRAGAMPDFRTLLGVAGWAGLAPAIRARFQANSTLCDFTGTAQLSASLAGRVLAHIMRLAGAPLPWITGVCETRVTIRKGEAGAVWDRAYRTLDQTGPNTARGRWIHARSMKRAEAGRLYECAGPVWMRLTLEARGGALAFLSDGFFLALGPLRLRLPDALTPGQLTVLHTDEGNGRFAFTLTCDHSMFGRMYDQIVRLVDTPAKGGDHD